MPQPQHDNRQELGKPGLAGYFLLVGLADALVHIMMHSQAAANFVN
jgi:hypothetical protein